MGKRLYLVALSLVGVAILVGAGVTAWKVKVTVDRAREVHAMVQDILDAPNKTMWQWEGWTPDQFFSDPQMLQVCDAISSKDMEVLQEAVRGVDDLNKQGASGVTLLHWALFDENLEAFEHLLQQGASPDLRLTDFIERDFNQPLIIGDSILFSSLQLRKIDFFNVALEHTGDINQENQCGETLLLVVTSIPIGYSIDTSVIRRLAEKGIELDRRDKYGGTAALRATDDWPANSLEILRAGGDPTIEDDQGNNVLSRLNSIIEWAENDPDRFETLKKEQGAIRVVRSVSD